MMLEPAGSNASWNTRDQHMAITVSRVRDRLYGITQAGSTAAKAGATKTKVIAWAHNSHIGNSAATARGGSDFVRNENWNLGQMIRHVVASNDKNDNCCFSIGLDTHQGTVRALTDDDDMQEDDSGGSKSYTLRPSINGSSEQLCHGVCLHLQCDAFWLPLQAHKIANAPPQLLQTLQARIPQRYVGVHYRAETELKSHYIDASLIGQYDALIFVDTTSALHVLSDEELQQAGQMTAATSSPPASKSNNKYGVRRLMQEYVKLGKEPIPNICVQPENDNLYHCHFVILFDDAFSVYAGGEYHGLLKIPKDYPMAPPRISFFTPSGRFEVGERICVSFSDYHPELWNPSWGVESVLVGLQSFFQEECPEAIGSILAPAETRRKLAKESREFNQKDQWYQQLFGGDHHSSNNTTTTEAFATNMLNGGEEKKDEDTPFCRYCRMTGADGGSGELISPCNCQGSNKWTHKECLAKWQYQAILSQSTHRKYQTDTEKFCNVCGAEFRTKLYSRDKVMVSFTGAEMANMIEPGCLLVATEKSSMHTLRLMEQYQDLQERLSHWVKSVFLVAQCWTSPDGKSQHIVGLSLSNEIEVANQAPSAVSFRTKALAELGLPPTTRTFIGGPCSPEVPHILFLAVNNCIKGLENDQQPEQQHCWKVLQGADVSLWYSHGPYRIRQALAWASNAVMETHVYWGCASWDRIQLLGEIARGGWGLAIGQVDIWTQRPTAAGNCWQSTLGRAIFAGENDFTRKYEDDDDSEEGLEE